MRRGAWAVSLFLSVVVGFGQQRNFVACPIVRDTRTAPCFLAEYDGEIYFLGSQPDAANGYQLPQLKHQVLVEGRVASGPRVCGGIPLEPLSISVMKEINLSCDTLLPPEPGIDAPVAARRTASRTSNSESVVFFAFNDDAVDNAGASVVSERAAYAKKMGASVVKVTGYRGTTVLSSGERLTEKAGLAEKRAQNVATLLRGLGVAQVSVDAKETAEAGDGTSDASRRRVTIVVTP